MKSCHPLARPKTRHNKVVTPSRRTTGWPKNKLPKQKVNRDGEEAFSNRYKKAGQ